MTKPKSAPESGGIAEINDQVRKTLVRDRLMLTIGISTLPRETQAKVFRAIEDFDDFGEDNDPWGEHDFGAVDVDGEQVFFKFDYFDNAFDMHSPDSTARHVTRRVLTVMLAREY